MKGTVLFFLFASAVSLLGSWIPAVACVHISRVFISEEMWGSPYRVQIILILGTIFFAFLGGFFWSSEKLRSIVVRS